MSIGAVLSFMVFVSEVAKGLELSPNVTYLYIVEDKSQEIDCFQDLNGGTADLRWSGPSQATYTVVNRNTPKEDGSSTFHHILKFLSFSLIDEGIYTCTLHSSSPQQSQIILHFQKDCARGQYGKNCSYSCAENCETGEEFESESPCNVFDGTCIYGCKSGYIEPYCIAECDYGKYGKNCIYNCSENCTLQENGKESPCAPVDGACKFGCRNGYTGPKCSTEPGSTQGMSTSTNTGIVALVVAVLVVMVVICVMVAVWLRRKVFTEKPEINKHQEEKEREELDVHPVGLHYEVADRKQHQSPLANEAMPINPQDVDVRQYLSSQDDYEDHRSGSDSNQSKDTQADADQEVPEPLSLKVRSTNHDRIPLVEVHNVDKTIEEALAKT